MSIENWSAASTGRGRLIVLVAGLSTTAAALFAVWWLSTRWDADPMLWYVEAIIPAGPICVGLGAAIGYIVASYYTGLRIGRRLLVILILCQITAYFVGHYVEFRSMHLVRADTGEPAQFWEYYHYQSMGFSIVHASGQSTPLGAVGYGIRLLEIGGFSAGVVLAPMFTLGAAYCGACQQYKRSHKFGFAPVFPKDDFADDPPADETPVAEASPSGSSTPADPLESVATKTVDDPAVEAYHRMRAIAQANNAGAFRKELELFGSRAAAKEQSSWIMELSLSYCPCCMKGDLQGVVVKRTDLNVQIDLLPGTPVTPAFVRPILERPR